MTSFVFDDGWDNPKSLWGFNPGFPDGFEKVSHAAAQYRSHIGVWMSPWGGYEQQKLDRIAFGKQHGYEIVDGGFALSGPKYFAKFQDTCLNMIHRTTPTNSNSTAPEMPIASSPVASSTATSTPAGPSIATAPSQTRTSSSTSVPAPIHRRSGCSMPMPSGAAEKITPSPASAPRASAGSPIVTRRSYKNIVKMGPLFPSTRSCCMA